VAGRLPTLVPRDARERRVIQLWRASNIRDGTIGVYLTWVRRFRAQCRADGVDEIKRLTLAEARNFATSYAGPRRGRRVKVCTRHCACNALHAWACALERLGEAVPRWVPPSAPRQWPALLQVYGEYRRAHRGVAPATLLRDMQLADDFVRYLHSRGRDVSGTRLKDIDNFIDALSARLGRRTVAGLCSSLRCFLRFLHSTCRLDCDLARCVVAPRFRVDERPPRALPWSTIRRIIRAIPRDLPLGRRDWAMFLLMAAYGLGAGEVVSIRLEDVDWRSGVIRARRPKTAVPIELPLLPAVARALAAYLRCGRPRHAIARQIFVSRAMPHRQLTTGALRHRVRLYARSAGHTAAQIGSHIFRHSHATRQIDAGAHPKIVSDILGHQRVSSMSVYVRVAIRRLRTVALPVPR
jgi:integrase/recombinase XerD